MACGRESYQVFCGLFPPAHCLPARSTIWLVERSCDHLEHVQLSWCRRCLVHDVFWGRGRDRLHGFAPLVPTTQMLILISNCANTRPHSIFVLLLQISTLVFVCVSAHVLRWVLLVIRAASAPRPIWSWFWRLADICFNLLRLVARWSLLWQFAWIPNVKIICRQACHGCRAKLSWPTFVIQRIGIIKVSD